VNRREEMLAGESGVSRCHAEGHKGGNGCRGEKPRLRCIGQNLQDGIDGERVPEGETEAQENHHDRGQNS